MMDDWLTKIIVGAIAAIGGVIGVIVARKSEKESNDTDRYQALFADMNTLMESQLRFRDAKIADLEAATSSLREHLDRIQQDLKATKVRFSDAVAHVIELRATHPDPPDPPESIRDEII